MTPREPFAELQTALSMTPSPEFAARVRARVAAETPGRSLVPHWAMGALLATAAAAFVVVTVSERHDERAQAPSVTTAQSVAASPTPVAQPSTVVASTTAPSRTTRVSANAPAASADPFYEVLVPADQRIALGRLLAAMKAGRASVPTSVVGAEVDEDGHLGIAPLPDIVPMKIEPLAGTPVDNIKREEIKKEQ